MRTCEPRILNIYVEDVPEKANPGIPGTLFLSEPTIIPAHQEVVVEVEGFGFDARRATLWFDTAGDLSSSPVDPNDAEAVRKLILNAHRKDFDEDVMGETGAEW